MFEHYLRQHRRQKGLTMEALAEKCGVLPSVISGFETGGQPIPLEMAVRLCQALDIRLPQLLEPPPDPADPARVLRREYMKERMKEYLRERRDARPTS